MNTQNQQIKEPIGRIMAKIGKKSLELLHQKLSYLDIERSFYPLLLIASRKGMTQQELADEIGVDKVQVVRIIDYLSENGYVERVMNVEDRRKYQLTATEKAEKIIPDIENAYRQISEITFKNIPENKKDELYVLLGKIEQNLKVISTDCSIDNQDIKWKQ